jgi:hypothetical protein
MICGRVISSYIRNSSQLKRPGATSFAGAAGEGAAAGAALAAGSAFAAGAGCPDAGTAAGVAAAMPGASASAKPVVRMGPAANRARYFIVSPCNHFEACQIEEHHAGAVCGRQCADQQCRGNNVVLVG